MAAELNASPFWALLHRGRLLLALAAVAASAALLPAALRVGVDPSNAAFLQSGPETRSHREFQRIFGSDDAIVAGAGDTDVYARPVVEWMDGLSAFGESMPEVLEVRSLPRLRSFVRRGFHLESEIAARPFLKGRETEEDFRSHVRFMGRLARPVVNESGRFAAVVFFLKPDLDGPARHDAIEKVRKWMALHPMPAGRVYFSGPAVEQDEFVKGVEQDHKRFVPLTLCVILAVIGLTQGSLAAVFYPLAVILCSLVSVQALMAFMHHSLNAVTTLVSPVLLIVSVSDAIHIQSHIQHAGAPGHEGRHLQALVRSLGLPCLLTSLTTAAGFLSLVISPVPAIRQFGFFASTGTLAALFWTFLLMPFFYILHVSIAGGRVHHGEPRFLQNFSGGIRKHRMFILAVFFAGAAAALLPARQIRVDTDILSSFPQDHAFRVSTEEIQKQLGGVYNLEVRVEAPSADAFWQAESLRQLLEFRAEVEALEGVGHVYYVTDLLRALDRTARDPEEWDSGNLPGPRDMARYREGLRARGGKGLDRVRRDDFRLTRMTVQLAVSDTSATLVCARRIRELAASSLPPGWKIRMAGETWLLARMSEQLVRSELAGMGLAFTVVTLLIILAMRSVKAGLISGGVNLVPVAMTAAFIPLAGMTLNTATATVASVSFGLIVDYAIHVLYQYRQAGLHPGVDPVSRVMTYCARPLVFSTLVLACGFAVTLTARIQPTLQFGALMIVVMILALLGNLVLLPAILAGMRHGEKI